MADIFDDIFGSIFGVVFQYEIIISTQYIQVVTWRNTVVTNRNTIKAL